MYPMDLVIQVIKPLIAKGVMCILSHIEFMQLMENHSLNLGIYRAFVS